MAEDSHPDVQQGNAHAIDQPEEGLDQSLQQEWGVISWDELARHFARGVVITVAGRLDLLVVAKGFAEDDKVLVEQWLAAEDVARASDDNARDWVARSPQFRCVVTAPWVLVQELQ